MPTRIFIMLFHLKKNSLSELSIYVSGKFRSLETVIRSIQTFKNESLLKGNRGLKPSYQTLSNALEISKNKARVSQPSSNDSKI